MTTRLVNRDIPPGERRLSASLLELGAPWGSPDPIRRALAALESLEWAAISRLSVSLDEIWLPYDRETACDAVWNGFENRYAVGLSSADGSVRASVARAAPSTPAHDHRNVVTFAVDQSVFSSLGAGGIEAAMARLSAVLPSFSLGRASAAEGLRFPSLIDVHPPPPFQLVYWLQILSAQVAATVPGGADYLLRAPVRAERHADGTIWLWAYDDPMRYDTPAAIDGMRALATYLRAPR